MSTGPKDGIYLDAALAVIGQQIDERIDALSRRRRVRARVGIAALSIAALASVSAAAYAFSTVAAQSSAVAMSPSPTVAGEVRCIDGVDAAAAAYFTASYRVGEKERVDDVALCVRAHDAIAAAPLQYEQLTPAQAVAAAVTLIGTDTVAVDRASFGTAVAAGAWHGICQDGEARIVLSSGVQLSPTEWSARCASAGFAGASR